MERGLGGRPMRSCPLTLLRKRDVQCLRFGRMPQQEHGEDALLDCLERNEKAGIVYHRNGINGDYGNFGDVEALIEFIRSIPSRRLFQCPRRTCPAFQGLRMLGSRSETSSELARLAAVCCLRDPKRSFSARWATLGRATLH